MARHHRSKKARVGVCSECKVRDGDSSEKRLIRCWHCANLLCKKHIAPRLTINRESIEKINDPTARDRIYKEWRKPHGHPDAVWTRKYFHEISNRNEDERKIFSDTLDSINKNYPSRGSGGQTDESPGIGAVPKPPIRISMPTINSRKIKRVLTNPIFWYVVYFSLLVIFNYLSIKNVNIYFLLIPYFKYPLYVMSAVLGIYIPYKLFKIYEYKGSGSDLQIWGYKILAGVLSFVSFIILMFGVLFLFASIISSIGRETGYSVAIFLGFLCLGIMGFSGYLMFKYQFGSGVIIHRGEGW